MTSVLQTAERVDRTYRYLAQQTDPSQLLVRTRKVDAAVPRAWRLSWRVASPGTAKAIRQHFATYGAGGEFPYTPPGGSAITCIYREPRYSERQYAGTWFAIDMDIEEALGADS